MEYRYGGAVGTTIYRFQWYDDIITDVDNEKKVIYTSKELPTEYWARNESAADRVAVILAKKLILSVLHSVNISDDLI